MKNLDSKKVVVSTHNNGCFCPDCALKNPIVIGVRNKIQCHFWLNHKRYFNKGNKYCVNFFWVPMEFFNQYSTNLLDKTF